MKEDRTITQICKRCGEPHVPTRRGVQKFCSATCRSKNYYHQTNKGKGNKSPNEKLHEAFEADRNKKTTVDEMSMSGVGNSFWGTLAAEAVAGVVKNAGRDSDKPATKGDIDELYETLNKRYLPIINYQDPFNRRAFYDKETFNIVVLNKQLNRMELPI